MRLFYILVLCVVFNFSCASFAGESEEDLKLIVIKKKKKADKQKSRIKKSKSQENIEEIEIDEVISPNKQLKNSKKSKAREQFKKFKKISGFFVKPRTPEKIEKFKELNDFKDLAKDIDLPKNLHDLAQNYHLGLNCTEKNIEIALYLYLLSTKKVSKLTLSQIIEDSNEIDQNEYKKLYIKYKKQRLDYDDITLGGLIILNYPTIIFN